MPYIMWGLTTLFFAFHFIFRGMPGLLMNQLMEQFSIDATAFGALSAMFYYGHAIMQIPMALALQRFGVRSVLSLCALVCAGSALLLSSTHSWNVALFSRFLMGGASCAALLGVSQTIICTFPKEKYARMLSFSVSLGFLGAIYGGKPTSAMITLFGWKETNVMLASLFVVIALLTVLFYRDTNTAKTSLSVKDLKHIIRAPSFWVLCVIMLLFVGVFEGFAIAWGISFLTAVYSFSKGDAAGLTSLIFVGFIIGAPLVALLSERFGNGKIVSLSGLIMTLLFGVILYKPAFLNSYSLSALFVLIGITCAYQVLILNMASKIGATLVENKNLGNLTVSFLNCIKLLGASCFHTVIGKLMDVFWKGEKVADSIGVKVYDTTSYTYALSVIPFCSILGLLIMIGQRKKIMALS